MLDFTELQIAEGVPLYLQIIEFVKRGIISGAIRHDEQLPSRRILAATLGVNPNTIQKAYSILEKEGWIESQVGAGSRTNFREDDILRLKEELLCLGIENVVQELKQMGLDYEEAASLLLKYWYQGEGNYDEAVED